MLKKENEVLKKEKAKYDAYIEQYKEVIIKSELLQKQKVMRLVNQIKELKSLKKQLA